MPLGALLNTSIYRIPVTDDSAGYMAEVCQNDPFYIAARFRTQRPGRDLRRPTAFLFHAERGLAEAQEAYLAEHGIMCSDGASLTGCAETAKEGAAPEAPGGT